MDKRKRELFIKKAKKETKEALKSRDVFLGNVSKTIDGMDEASHILMEKLEELYSSYFPELKLEDKKKYAKIALFFDKKAPDEKMLEKIVGQDKTRDLILKAQNSLGADLKQEDLKIIKTYAKELINIYSLRDSLNSYLEELAQEICPNMKHITNASIAAKLIAHVGSLRKLALLPASTIQVLGAEKALFKHLRSKRKINPPKHGIIFQYPQIGTAPKTERGKLARLFATKLAIAAKADAFSHNFVAKELKDNIEKRLKEIRNKK